MSSISLAISVSKAVKKAVGALVVQADGICKRYVCEDHGLAKSSEQVRLEKRLITAVDLPGDDKRSHRREHKRKRGRVVAALVGVT